MSRKAETTIVDTHVLIWFTQGNLLLGEKARERIRRCVQRRCLVVSAMSAWEIALLVRKGRLALRVSPTQWWAAAKEDTAFRELDLTSSIALQSQQLEDFHPDPADRFLVSSAIQTRLPMLTADRDILNWSKKHTRAGLAVIDAAL